MVGKLLRGDLIGDCDLGLGNGITKSFAGIRIKN